MRSVYQPDAFSIPRPLTAIESLSLSLGGDCDGAKASRLRSPTTARENPVDALLAPLVERALRAGSALSYSPVGEFHHGLCRYRLPRFVFQGPPGGGNPVRLGLFAAIHGDEPEGAAALCDFLLRLDDDPALAQGYELYVYPVCNPSGLEDGTRHSRAGHDLNQEFWRGSAQPEVYFLERELGVLQFTGLVVLQSDGAANGAYAFVGSATLTEALAKPALAAAAKVLPLADGKMSSGLSVRDGLTSKRCEGILSNPAELNPMPFEIILGTPQTFPASRQKAAVILALGAILREYHQFLAYGQNL